MIFIGAIELNLRAFAKYLCAVLLFGLNGIVASHIQLSSYEIVFLRTCIGSVLLVALFLLGRRRFRCKENKRDYLFISLSGIAMGACWLFLYEAYQQIGVSFASLLYYCGPVIMMVLSPVLFNERLTWPKVAGFLIVLVGIVLVNGTMVEQGDAWGLFCGAMSAVMLFLVVTLNKKSQNVVGLENSAAQLTASFVTVAIFVGFKQGLSIDIPTDAYLWVLLLGVVNTGIGCFLYFTAISDLPMQTVAAFGYLEPLTAVVAAAVLLGEHMTSLQIVGAVCIIGGAMMCELVKGKAR